MKEKRKRKKKKKKRKKEIDGESVASMNRMTGTLDEICFSQRWSAIESQSVAMIHFLYCKENFLY